MNSFPSSLNRTKYSRMDQVKFVEDSLPQILLGSFLNTWTQISSKLNDPGLSITEDMKIFPKSRDHIIMRLLESE